MANCIDAMWTDEICVPKVEKVGYNGLYNRATG